MKHTSRWLSAAVLPAFLLTSLVACGDDVESSTSESDAVSVGDAATIPAIEVDGEDVTGFDWSKVSDQITETEVVEVEAGEGPAIAAGDSVTFDYYGAVYEGDEAFDESYSASPATFSVGVGGLIPAWDEGLIGVKEGSRVLIAAAAEDAYGDNPPPGSPIKAGDPLYFVIDVVQVQKPPAPIKSQPLTPQDASAVPAVLQKGQSVTGLDWSAVTAESQKTQVFVARAGKGKAIAAGDMVTVNYYGSVYEGQKPFDSSFSRGEPAQFPVGTGNLIQAWDRGLLGVKAGSRVIIVADADDAYGDAPSPGSGIEPGDTLYFVIDVISVG